MARVLFLFVIGALVVSCAPPNAKPDAQTVSTSQNKRTAVEAAKRSPASPDELKRLLDLEEYPSATMVSNTRLTSDDFAPDEARFELVRKTSDAPEKVIKFFEEKLGAKATGESGHKEVWGPTKRGHFVKAHFDSEGSGTSYTLTIITYVK